MFTSMLDCYRCRFSVDLHINPRRSYVATLKETWLKKESQPTSNSVQETQRSETYAAAWPHGKPERAIVFEVSKFGDLPPPSLHSDTIELYVSRQFLIEYGLDPSIEYAFKELETCPALQLVVLHGPQHLLAEAQTREWQNRWCETLVRPGSDLGGLTVTDTRPTRFGIVTLNTQVIIVEGSSKPIAAASAERSLRLTNGLQMKESTSEGDAKVSDCNTDDMTLQPLLGLPIGFRRALRSAAKDDANTTDPDRCVYLSQKKLSELGMKPFSWAKVEVGDVSRIVRVVPLTIIFQEEVSDGVVFATPQLILNLSGSQLPISCSLVAVKDYPISYALEFGVGVVKSPHYNHQSDYSALLKWHFECQSRLLAKGDVFGVSQKEFFEYSPDLRATRAYDDAPVVYFRVGSIAGPEKGEPQSLWTNAETSTLYQLGAAVSRVPRCMELMVDRTYHPVFNSPKSVFPDVAELADMIGLFYARAQMSRSLQPLFLISGPSNSGKRCAVQSIALSLGLHLLTVNGSELTGDTPSAAETRIRNGLAKASMYGPCLVHVANVEDIFRNVIDTADTRLVSVFLESVAALNRCPGEIFPIVVIATSNEPRRIPSQVIGSVLHHLVVPPMRKEDRQRVLEFLLADDVISSSLDLDTVADKTAGFVLGDLSALVDFARKNLYRREMCGPTMVGMGASLTTPILTMDDLSTAISQIQRNHSKSIGAPEIPSVRWDDIGGLEVAKKEILDTIQFPLKHPNFGGVSSGGNLTRSGILLYGPPGTGKTLLAKAVATECSLNFLSVKGPELINMYIGQSEDNVRKVFEKARSAAPCVIFFDELDSLAPRRGRSGDSGGVMDRVVSQLLAEMDGLGKAGSSVDGGQVFVIGATNRPDLLDTAILRPGRLDRLVYVDIPEEPEVKHKVLRALTRKLTLRDVDLAALSEQCPPHLTGADLYSLCANAMINAVRRCIDTHSKKLVVINEDFERALEKLTPSVSAAELQSYRKLRDKFAH